MIGACTALILARMGAAEAEPVNHLPPGGVPPVPVRQSPPAYPPELAYSGITGRVTVDFIIDQQGNVINPVVVTSNNPWFERAAINSILKWKFKPGEVGGRKVNVRARQVLLFEIDGRPGTGLWQPPSRNDQKELPEEYQWTKAPVPTNTAFPVYPFAALQAGVKGKVRVNLLIGPSGRVVATKVIQSATPELDAAMLAMLDTWSFTPPEKKDGTRCFAAVAIQMSFNPDNYGDVPVTSEARQILRQLKKSPEKILELSALDAVPKPLSRRPPVYPTSQLAAGKKGEALIVFFIDREGDVQLPAIISSSAPEFGYAAVQAIATWRFEPPRKGGKPVVAHARIPLEFAVP